MKHSKHVLIILILLVVVAIPTNQIKANLTQSALSTSKNGIIPVQTLPEDPFTQLFPAIFKAAPATCHFGIAVVNNWNTFDLSLMGVGNYVDWWRDRDKSVPTNIDYYRVLNVDDAGYARLKTRIPGYLINSPGSFWIIGNEPDSEVTYQDHISAETYGERFFELATIIRRQDPKARIGFGPIIQPTPIRLYYLTLAMNKLAELAGSPYQAHSLIDFYPIHSFILNEADLYGPDGNAVSWGAGVPIGYNPATWPAPELIRTDLGESYKTYDINIFKSRVINFRKWMKDQGEQNKPLWITEFGSLFPSQGNPYLYASDSDTANFMVQTFDFMLGYKDPNLGFREDDSRLVQKWTWYSLNDSRNRFGGSLIDPETNKITYVGERFIQYNPSLKDVPITNPDVYVVPDLIQVAPNSFSLQPGQVNYTITIKVSNNLSSDRLTEVQVDLSEADVFFGTVQVVLPRCGGAAQAAFVVKDLIPGGTHTFTARISLLTGNGTDTNLSNNQFTYSPITLQVPDMAYSTFLPAVFR